MIVGQEKICRRIDNLTTETIPRTLLLLGDYGSGKHTLVNYISDKFKFPVEDISENLTLEYIDNITQRVSPMIYVIESNKLTVKNENVILKFLEEPLKNSFIIVLSENKYNIIPTVLNRCQVWELETYSRDLLKSFISNSTVNPEILLQISNTPGKVIEYQSYPIKDMMELGYKIFDNIGRANVANVLTLSRFLGFKNEKDKFDVDLFFDILLLVSKELCYTNPNFSTRIYELTNELNYNKYIFNIDKKALFENYLIRLKLLTESGCI